MTHSKSDYWKDGLPVHEISYCAFLDVLGFSNRISESFVREAGNELLREFHSIFQSTLTQIKSDANSSSLYFKTFSDNVLLAHPRFSSDMESEFAFILWSLRQYQFDMALNGFFIRGGLSVGDLFVSEDNVYGPALVAAHTLESEQAVYPIVILSAEVKELVDAHTRFYSVRKSPQYRDILVDERGNYFINYLMECVIEGYEGEYLDSRSLRKHKEKIEKCLLEFKDNPRVFAKYSWLAGYHDFFCDLVAEYPGYEDSMKLNAGFPVTQFGRLSN